MSLSIFEISKNGNPIKCEINLPASKSISNRVLILHELMGANFTIKNLSNSDDTLLIKKILNNYQNEKIINVDNCGTAMRFLTAFFAMKDGKWVLDGDERMSKRPIYPLVDSLNLSGAKINYLEQSGYPPIEIIGNPNISNKISISGELSSQYVSALLLISPFLKNGLEITLSGKSSSAPYITMSLDILKIFNVNFKFGNNKIIVTPGFSNVENFNIENDWSAASYWYMAASLSKNSEVILNNLTKNSFQGDLILWKIFENIGVESSFSDNNVILKNIPTNQDYFEFDFTDYPDLFPAISIVCALKNIPSKLTGLKNLKIKESNRLMSIYDELSKIGFKTEISESSMNIFKSDSSKLNFNKIINTYNDHRLAMAFSMMSLASGTIKLNNPNVVSKSYPHFYEDMKKAEFIIT